MADSDSVACHKGVRGSQGDDVVTPGSTLCGKCCHTYVMAERYPPAFDSTPHCMMRLADRKFIVLKDDGTPVVDWASLRATANADRAWHYSGNYIPDWDEDYEETVKYPREKPEEAGRTYANAHHVHVYTAILAFLRKHHKKPRGEELHRWLHCAWNMYQKLGEAVRAARQTVETAR